MPLELARGRWSQRAQPFHLCNSDHLADSSGETGSSYGGCVALFKTTVTTRLHNISWKPRHFVGTYLFGPGFPNSEEEIWRCERQLHVSESKKNLSPKISRAEIWTRSPRQHLGLELAGLSAEKQTFRFWLVQRGRKIKIERCLEQTSVDELWACFKVDSLSFCFQS